MREALDQWAYVQAAYVVGVLGTLARWFRRSDTRTASGDNFDLKAFMQQSLERLFH